MCFFSIVTRFLIIVFGILRSARCTQLALDDMELTAWAKYWIVYAFLFCLEIVVDTFFAWMPLYVEIKLLIVLWLVVSAPQASVWVFDTILNPLLNQHMHKIDNFLLYGKRNFLDDAITYTSVFCKQTFNAVLPVVSRIWKKNPSYVHPVDSIEELHKNEKSNIKYHHIPPVLDTVCNSFSSQYYDTNAEEDSYEVTYPSSNSQSQTQLHGSGQRNKNHSKHSLPELAKKAATQLNPPAPLRPKRKQYVYDTQFDDTALKNDPLGDIEESLLNQHITVERLQRASRKEPQRYQ